MDEICRRCLITLDKGRHNTSCRVKKCPDCLAPGRTAHADSCPRLIDARLDALDELCAEAYR